jgi:hypothetical protein
VFSDQILSVNEMLLKVEGNVIWTVLHVLAYAIVYINLVHALLFYFQVHLT